MKRIRKLLYVLIMAFSLLFACDKTEGEGGGGLQPSDSDAKITEGFLCSYVSNGRPEGIDNEFYQDDLVYIWMSWGNVEGRHTVRTVWSDPNGDTISDTEKAFTSRNGHWVNYFYIDTTASAPTGRWLVEIYIDGEFVRSYAFWIYEY